MFEKCPFYPNEVRPPCQSCQFLRNGGCAILLAAYSQDVLKEAKKTNNKLEDIKNDIEDIKRKLSC